MGWGGFSPADLAAFGRFSIALGGAPHREMKARRKPPGNHRASFIHQSVTEFTMNHVTQDVAERCDGQIPK
jgi:hypothetical protein